MEIKNLKHSDCFNFSRIDAAKGICRVSGNLIPIDSKVCSNFKKAAKCKFCKNFKEANKDGIGVCVGLEKEAWCHEELDAVTCEGYHEK
ncbi:4-hydroxyphenylacetate decarboxylase small subunit [Clostridium aestuarii]|uniref:4-hydroxyphenylacetate decarboxylase small subunit n=1 Tax=Clostridium aestuarii TaxID=338193 RepID=A0ABT4CZ15_9CLOT|nr:4-hydroxyphenylacetate decarboxylase small subunit [Clostridium aestuarii]MCY6484077.1 4-hydroxyphenylacetate decarboxylase small subunit [Clostridium aestuarii]